MTKIYLKLALMIVLALVWCIGICGADAMMESGHWFVLMCMVILPIALFLFVCRSGMVEDVMQWIESLEKKLSDC